MNLRFDDGTSFPLSSIPDAEYSLTAETLNNQVVTLAPPRSGRAITLTAVSPGSGELVRLSFGITDVCALPKLRPLAVGFAHVDVDFDEFTQNDASYFKADIDRFDGRHEVKTDKGPLFVTVDRGMTASDDRGRFGRRRNNGKVKSTMVESTTLRQAGTTNLEDEEFLPRIEAQKQLQSVVEVRRSTTSLEMAMYILLAVFAASVVIFAANCMVFLTRYRRKRKFTENKEPVSEVCE
jgi:transmembrane protein 132